MTIEFDPTSMPANGSVPAPERLHGHERMESTVRPISCTWLDALPERYRTELLRELRAYYETKPEILEVEQRSSALERYFRHWPAMLEPRERRNVPPPNHWAHAAGREYSKSLSDAAFIVELSKRGVIDVDSVRTLLDLGSGFWNYACLLPHVFPNLTRAVGLEIDPKKREGYASGTAPVHGLDPAVFSIENRDMRMLDESPLIREIAPVDAALIFNPEVPTFRSGDYRRTFQALHRMMAPSGIVVAAFEERRAGSDGNPALLQFLTHSGIPFETLSTTRFTNSPESFLNPPRWTRLLAIRISGISPEALSQ